MQSPLLVVRRVAASRSLRISSFASLSTILVAAAVACTAPASEDAGPLSSPPESEAGTKVEPSEAGPGTDAGGGGDVDGGGGATPVTMVDCTTRPNDDKDPKCVSAVAGTVGTGPKFTGGLTTQVGHGFISGNQLIVAVELTGADDEYGGIFGVDLTTGDRTLLSGKLNDPVNGEVSKGTGPAETSLNGVRDVAQGPNNTWIAFAAKNVAAERVLFSIDPATGNRKVIFKGTSTACTGIANNATVAFDNVSGLAVGPDGASYLALNNIPQGSGKGIAKVTPDGKCSVVTLSAATVAANNKGSGPTMIGSFLYNVTYQNDALYLLQFNTHPSILSINPVTGNRTMISVSPDKGTGPDLATDSMAVSPDGQTIWTYNAVRNGKYGLVSADVATGNRTPSEPKGGPAKKAQAPDRGIWVHPDGAHLLLQYANSIILYEPATGNSNTLSY